MNERAKRGRTVQRLQAGRVLLFILSTVAIPIGVTGPRESLNFSSEVSKNRDFRAFSITEYGKRQLGLKWDTECNFSSWWELREFRILAAAAYGRAVGIHQELKLLCSYAPKRTLRS